MENTVLGDAPALPVERPALSRKMLLSPTVRTAGRRILRAAGIRLLAAAIGFALGRARLLASLSPFAVALTACSPQSFTLAGVLGASAGTLSLAADASAIRCIGALSAAAAMNRLLERFITPRERRVAAPIISLLCCLATGLTAQLASGFSASSMLIFLCEGLISAAAAYAGARLFAVRPLPEGGFCPGTGDAVCAGVVFSVLLYSLSSISLGVFVPARFLAAALSLAVSRAVRPDAGAGVGVCAGSAAGIACSLPSLGACFGVSALLAGIFSSLGAAASGAVFALACSVWCVLSGEGIWLAVLIEAAAASLVVCAVPSAYLTKMRHKLVRKIPETPHNEAAKDISLRLSLAASALGGVSECVERVSAGLQKASPPDGSEDVRGIVGTQFRCLSDILTQLSGDIGGVGRYDPRLSAKAARALEDEGLHVLAASCREDADGKMSVSVRAERTQRQLSRRALSDAVSRACGRGMGIPCAVPDADTLTLSFSQKPMFKVSLGAVQRASGGAEYCGDYFECFDDGRGHEAIILSDGMGTGGRAAVDAAMTSELFSKLLKAGIEPMCAVSAVNSALRLKSSEESTATLDASFIDLCTGRTEFIKAGSAATFVRKRGRTARLELASLPLGILGEVKPARASAVLGGGDMIVMISDGVSGDDDSWIRHELASHRASSAQETAEAIADRAALLRGDGREDDMTVVTALIEKVR